MDEKSNPNEPAIATQLRSEREGWQKRVSEEYDELKQRTERLASFINSSSYYAVSDHEKGLLSTQLGHMKAYVDILKQRVDHLRSA